MSFVSNALGISNGYSAASAAGPNGRITYDPNLVANATTANANYGAANTAQGNLAAQLQAQANGQGPNIANLQLQQATNQNNQQTAGAIASQRGMNPALAQRIILQQQAMNNQNAAGQSGILRAQQQLAAQGQLGNVLGQQAGEATSNAAANYSALGNQNNAVVGAVNSANQANAQIAQNNANQNSGIAGGIMNTLGGSSITSMLAEGGIVKQLEKLSIPVGTKVHPLHLAGGGGLGTGFSNNPTNAIDPGLAQGPSAAANNLFGGFSGGSDPTASATSMQGQDATEFGGSSVGSSGASGLTGAVGELGPLAMLAAAKGGQIPVVLSPGELKIPAHKVMAVAQGKEKASEVGQRIPGKAKVKGDNLKNDTYATHANAGDVIIKRTKAQNDGDAREFLLAIKADKEKKNGPSGYAKILAVKRKNA